MIYCNDYIYEITNFSKQLNLDFLQNTNLLISGGTGLIGSYLIDSLLINKSLNVNITCLTTNSQRAVNRFGYFSNDSRLKFYECDLTSDLQINQKFDYVLHLASFSDAHNYAKYPVETMLMNFNGAKNLLEIARKSNTKKFFYASSSEIYGTSNEEMSETNQGVVNTLDIRSCYNESKRASETLCISYSHEHNIDCVIGRFSRVYGPSMIIKDSKALSQFLKNALNGEDIVLKSKGDQLFSYCYVSDAVNAIFYILQFGENCNAYNISNNLESISLKNIAEIVSSLNNKKVIIDLPSEIEKIGYTRVTKALLPTDKLEKLGWKPTVNIQQGIEATYKILKQIY